MIHIEYGTYDLYPWIPQGCVYTAKVLADAGIPNEIVAFEGGHAMTQDQVQDRMVPFFQRYLSFQ